MSNDRDNMSNKKITMSSKSLILHSCENYPTGASLDVLWKKTCPLVFYNSVNKSMELTQRTKCNINIIKTFRLVSMHATFSCLQTCSNLRQ